MKKPVLAGMILALVVGAGCTTATPVRYYTLNMIPSGNPPAAVNIVIDRLRSVESLARKDILIKKTPTEIEYYASDQWAAGIDELVTEKLIEEFGTPSDQQRTLILSGVIQAFEQVDTPGGALAHAKLSAEFRKDRYGDVLMTRVYDATAAVDSSSASAVVAGLSKCLETIARNIAADAAKL